MNPTKNNKALGKVLQITTYAFLSVGLSGCIKDTTDLEMYFDEHRSKQAKAIDPIPEIKPYLRYVYPGNEKDPFDVSMLAPSEVPIVDNGIKVDTTRVKEFLEGFPLDSLQMVGTVSKDSNLWALIKIPDGGVQSVKAGNYVGQNYGKIVSVSEAELGLMETVSNGLGGYKEQENRLLLDQ